MHIEGKVSAIEGDIALEQRVHPAVAPSRQRKIPLPEETMVDQQQRMIPLINGSDTNFSRPFVLTAGSVGATLTTRNLTGAGGTIDDGQYWSTVFGAL